jgi:hypothetical protein
VETSSRELVKLSWKEDVSEVSHKKGRMKAMRLGSPRQHIEEMMEKRIKKRFLGKTHF